MQRTLTRTVSLSLFLLGLAACGDDTPSDPGSSAADMGATTDIGSFDAGDTTLADTGSVDASEDAGVDDPGTDTGELADSGNSDATDDDAANDDAGGEDTGTADVFDPATANIPPPTDSLVAGVATRSLGFPIGTATVGYQPQFGPKTPYAVNYPGTNGQHTDLTVKALVLRHEGNVVVIARTDTAGIWQELTFDVQMSLRALGRADLADGLLIGATHTHSGGGRIFYDSWIGEFAVGPFLPGFYQRARDAIVDAVIEADAAAVPAQIGHTSLQTDMFHHDRRCENGPIQDDTMGLILVETAEGAPLALVINYAMHGTTLGTGDYVLSSDAPGAIEFGIESRFDAPITAIYLQSWAGDMAPRSPSEYQTEVGHDLRNAYRSLTAIAAGAADVIIPELEDVAMDTDPELAVLTVTFPLDNALINTDGSFDAYPYGGIYCMTTEDNCGEDAVPYDRLICARIPDRASEDWSMITAARIGSLGLVTLPGEPLTSIGVELRQRTIEAMGVDDAFVVGYAQSYLSYLLHPDDFWWGGYEGGSAIFGPGFGQYLVNVGVAVAERLTDPESTFFFEPFLLEEAEPLQYEGLTYEDALGEPAVSTQPTSEGNFRAVTWTGGDPAIDTPLVTLEVEGDSGWETLRHVSGRAVDSSGPDIELLLETDPAYEEALFLDERTFHWTAQLPNVFAVPPSIGQFTGRMRFVIQGTRPDSYELVSDAFDL